MLKRAQWITLMQFDHFPRLLANKVNSSLNATHILQGLLSLQNKGKGCGYSPIQLRTPGLLGVCFAEHPHCICRRRSGFLRVIRWDHMAYFLRKNFLGAACSADIPLSHFVLNTVLSLLISQSALTSNTSQMYLFTAGGVCRPINWR